VRGDYATALQAPITVKLDLRKGHFFEEGTGAALPLIPQAPVCFQASPS
jgi:hypothetical protein